MTTRADQVNEVELDDSVDPDDAVEPDETSTRAWKVWVRRHFVLTVLFVAAALLTGAGTWFLVDAHGMRSSASAQNKALVDTTATAKVSASVTNSLNKVFSYSFDKTEVTEQAATTVLRGQALDAYRKLYGQVRALAPQQKLALTTRVVSAAVQTMTGDQAQLLVFLDQSATKADNATASTAAAQLSVTAKREGDAWVITELLPR